MREIEENENEFFLIQCIPDAEFAIKCYLEVMDETLDDSTYIKLRDKIKKEFNEIYFTDIERLLK